MFKEKSKNWRAIAFMFAALLLIPFYLSTAFARSNGTITSSNACTDCHSSLGMTTVMILGPNSVAHDSVNIYEIIISRGFETAVRGGIDVYTGDGILGLIDASTQATQLVTDGNSGLDEVTHNPAKEFDLTATDPQDDPNTVSWLFSWTAPSELGSYDLFAQVVEGDGSGTGGDWTGFTTFSVQVVPIPAAAYLFGSALGLLGWLRFRKGRPQITGMGG